MQLEVREKEQLKVAIEEMYQEIHSLKEKVVLKDAYIEGLIKGVTGSTSSGSSET